MNDIAEQTEMKTGLLFTTRITLHTHKRTGTHYMHMRM